MAFAKIANIGVLRFVSLLIFDFCLSDFLKDKVHLLDN